MTDFVNQVIEGDCLHVLNGIEDQRIDMIICDLPYGNTNNGWDEEINLVELWKQYKRVIKPSGVIALTAAGAFTGKIIMSNLEWFRYKIVWIKSKATNFLNAKKQPLRKHEDICIFYKDPATYNPQMGHGQPYDKGTRKGGRTGSYGDFGDARMRNDSGKRYPVDVVRYPEDELDHLYCKTTEHENLSLHPTQKPIALGRYLIRTFSNPGDLILDNACGCGSFLVSAVLESRKFIGIERNVGSFRLKHIPVDFIQICRQRISTAQQTRELFNQSTDIL